MNPAKLMLSIAMTAISLTAPTADASEAAILSSDEINDLALLYIGSNHRSKWDKEILRPYVVHTYPDGHSSWMFDGFLMVEFVLFSEDGSQNFSIDGDWPYGMPAMKSHWEYILEHQLGLESNTGCKAIDEIVNDSDIAYGGDCYIYIDDRAGNAAIYSLDGRCIYNGSSADQAGTERLSYGLSVSCLPGVYLVRSGAKTVKVLVK